MSDDTRITPSDQTSVSFERALHVPRMEEDTSRRYHFSLGALRRDFSEKMSLWLLDFAWRLFQEVIVHTLGRSSSGQPSVFHTIFRVSEIVCVLSGIVWPPAPAFRLFSRRDRDTHTITTRRNGPSSEVDLTMEESRCGEPFWLISFEYHLSRQKARQAHHNELRA